MTQRGITRSMIDLVLEYGEVNQDKTYIDKKHAQQLVKELSAKLRAAKKELAVNGSKAPNNSGVAKPVFDNVVKH
jgi:Holliday junction resolvasome RuvABC DNA-binding subunit